MKEKRINEFKGILLVAAGLIVLASLLSFDPNDLGFHSSHPNVPPHNLIRTFGAYLGWIIIFFFGRWACFIMPLFMLWAGIKLFRNDPPYLSIPRMIGLGLLAVSCGSLIGLIIIKDASVSFYHAGFLGFIISRFINNYFGQLGGYILFITLILLSLALVTEIMISTFLVNSVDKAKLVFVPFWKKRSESQGLIKKIISGKKALRDKIIKPRIAEVKPVDLAEEAIEKPGIIKPKVKIKAETDKPASENPKPRPKEVLIGDYRLPGLDLLDSPPPLEARQIKEDLTNNARVLQDTLEDFGIAVKVTDIERGPIITRYELEPAPGVKLNRIVALGDDIALAMKAQSVRIVAPIPGKARVGVEVPNMQSTLVYLKELLAAKEFQDAKSKLTISLGKDIAGAPVVGYLDQMPHLLIAGTTGAGKTVCVNSVILSLLWKCSPNELKMVMIDPKMVELAPFNGLPHLLCPVVTESKKAAGVLNWVVNEMEHRYRLLAEAGARNIIAYNEKQPKEWMPYIVVLIDEFADLMMVARDQVESAVTRLAQLSRAVGIHLVLATQRPSVDVITGVIKANLPARISFKVASKVDSRTVLDMNGADKLLGRGDMLFLKPQDAKIVRAQGALVTDKEIERVVDFIKAQAEPVYNEEVLKDPSRSGSVSTEKDDLYDEAVRVVIESNQASVSILQRRMRLGYTRAARMIDMMEEDGIVGPYEGSKPRRLLVDRDEWLKNQVMPGKQAG
ncbi:MAG: DNA translocase FtsK [Candidatus Omnitrophica bacterium]|nr:DNA translocase FtsK [Candidatus Omnitrophota bacterium]